MFIKYFNYYQFGKVLHMIFINIVVFFTNYSKEIIIMRYDEKRLDYQFTNNSQSPIDILGNYHQNASMEEIDFPIVFIFLLE